MMKREQPHPPPTDLRRSHSGHSSLPTRPISHHDHKRPLAPPTAVTPPMPSPSSKKSCRELVGVGNSSTTTGRPSSSLMQTNVTKRNSSLTLSRTSHILNHSDDGSGGSNNPSACMSGMPSLIQRNRGNHGPTSTSRSEQSTVKTESEPLTEHEIRVQEKLLKVSR